MATQSVRPLSRAVWIGDRHDAELALARGWARDTLAAHGGRLEEFSDPFAATTDQAADSPAPRLAFLAAATPTRWTLADALMLSRAWPLMPIVSVAASLVEGRRRSGPALTGIEEVPWHDLPGRLESWLSCWDAALPGTLGVPTTARRDERVGALAGGVAPPAATPGKTVAVVAATPLDADGMAALVTAAGGAVAGTACGRPALDEPAAVLVWEMSRLSADHAAWLRLLSANRPSLRTIVVESFPRGDSVQAALDAGAAAVLGRPVSLEALAGWLGRLEAELDGLGAPPRGR